MKKHVPITLAAAFGLLSVVVLVPIRQAADAQDNTPKDFVPPVVFQAAGPNRRLDSEFGRCVPRGSGRPQQR